MLLQGASAAAAIPAFGDPAIGGAKQPTCPRHMPGREKRPAPPDVTRQLQNRIRAAKDVPAASQDTHLAEQFLFGKPKMGPDPRSLERQKIEATPFEQRPRHPDHAAAEFAIGVI